jgi:hypothetical protein
LVGKPLRVRGQISIGDIATIKTFPAKRGLIGDSLLKFIATMHTTPFNFVAPIAEIHSKSAKRISIPGNVKEALRTL